MQATIVIIVENEPISDADGLIDAVRIALGDNGIEARFIVATNAKPLLDYASRYDADHSFDIAAQFYRAWRATGTRPA